jgi:hypothetical protein
MVLSFITMADTKIIVKDSSSPVIVALNLWELEVFVTIQVFCE